MNKTLKTFLMIILGVSLFAVGFYSLGNSLSPLMLSLFFAYLLFPLVQRLEKWGLRREFACFGVFCLIVVLLLGIAIFVIPVLIKEAKLFFSEWPQYFKIFMDQSQTFLHSFGITLPLNQESLVELIREYSSRISFETLKSATLLIKSAFTNVAGAIIAILNLFLLPLFFYYIIKDFEILSEKIYSLFPDRYRSQIYSFLSKANIILNGYIRGQLMVALILGALYALGLWVVGLRFSILVGFLSGLLNIIPYAGFVIGFSTALVLTMSSFSVALLIGVVVVFISIQALEGIIITPKVVGDKVGLSPLMTILALIMGGNLAGLWGMFLAIPVAGIIRVLMIELFHKYKNSHFYKGCD